MPCFRSITVLFPTALLLGTAYPAFAQDPSGAPPPDIDKAAPAPAAPIDAPKLDKAPEGISASISAGGLSSSGNSRLLAATATGAFDSRFSDNGFGASLLANYGRSAPPGEAMQVTVENLQARLRYDRYVLEDGSVFVLATGRRDRLQGIAFRLNIDPGFKYLFVNRAATALWGELGYDFQRDIRTDEGRTVLDADGEVIEVLDKTATDHSLRAFLGFRQAFSEDVGLSTGLEYLQSFIDTSRFRANYDVLFTARVVGQLALGVGFNAKFDNAPLPDKTKLDTTTSLNLVYSIATAAP